LQKKKKKKKKKKVAIAEPFFFTCADKARRRFSCSIFLLFIQLNMQMVSPE